MNENKEKKKAMNAIVKKPYYLCVIACFKNESHILHEWMKHYFSRGFDHIYLINDHSTDSFEQVLSQFPAESYTLYNNDVEFEKCGRQVKMYERFSKEAILKSTWLAVLDLDEFLYSPLKTNLKSLFLEFELNGIRQVTVDWVHFGSSSRIVQPSGGVVAGFLMRESFDTFRHKKYFGVKSIVLTATLKNIRIHQHEITKISEKDSDALRLGWTVNKNILLVNHYAIQSLQFFMDVKCVRGDSNRWIATNARNLEMFRAMDNNDIEDTRLRNQSQ